MSPFKKFCRYKKIEIRESIIHSRIFRSKGDANIPRIRGSFLSWTWRDENSRARNFHELWSPPLGSDSSSKKKRAWSVSRARVISKSFVYLEESLDSFHVVYIYKNSETRAAGEECRRHSVDSISAIAWKCEPVKTQETQRSRRALLTHHWLYPSSCSVLHRRVRL